MYVDVNLGLQLLPWKKTHKILFPWESWVVVSQVRGLWVVSLQRHGQGLPLIAFPSWVCKKQGEQSFW